MVVYNPYSYEAHEDPYPIYKELRERAPLYHNEEVGFWALSRHADVLATFRDSKRFSNRMGVSLEPSAFRPEARMVSSFLAMDPPRHDRMRALVSRGFTPRRVANLEPSIRRLARDYIDRFISDGHCDLIHDFAGRLPMDVVSEMLGVPPADRDRLRACADAVLHREDGVMDVPASSMEASAKMIDYFRELVADHKRRASDDLTAALLDAEVDGERLSDSDVVAFLFLMIIAGNETTTKLLGNAFYWLWKNPGERDKVSRDRGSIPRWVEETLRYDGSSQAIARLVLEDVELHGRTVPKGEKLLLLIGAANRDERVFPDPDVYDIDRDTTAMLSFGHGTHFCLGASLARLEARVSLEELYPLVSSYEIDPGGLVRVHSINVRGFAAMPMEFQS